MRHRRPSTRCQTSFPVQPGGRFGLCAVAMLFALTLLPGVALADARPPADAIALTTQEIRDAFTNVRDDAEVQDAAGTRAVNYW